MVKRSNNKWGILVGILLLLSGVIGGYWYYKTRPLLHDKVELVEFLQTYIRINTAQPKPDYRAAIQFFKQHAQRDGLQFQEIMLPSGRPAVVIAFKGSDATLPALGLNSHMDVVSAPNPEQWGRPPFRADIVNDVMIGRGTQDCKGVGAIQYWVLKTLAASGVRLRRSVYQLLTPEEELGGGTGSGQLVKTAAFKALNIGFLIDENAPSGTQGVFDIKISEKKPVWLNFKSVGAQAHGSKMIADNAIEKLLYALVELKRVVTATQRKDVDPGLQWTANVTSLQAGDAATINVIPATAVATVDMRVPPQESTRKALDALDNILKRFPGVQYTLAREVFDYVQPDVTQSALTLAAKRAAEGLGFQARFVHAEGASDSKFYMQHGITCIGITPFFVEDREHRVDECVPLTELEYGYALMFNVVKDFCA